MNIILPVLDRLRMLIRTLGGLAMLVSVAAGQDAPAAKPNVIYILTALKEALFTELMQQADPRMSGQGEVFDKYLHASPANVKFCERFMRGEKVKAGWVKESDFEKAIVP